MWNCRSCSKLDHQHATATHRQVVCEPQHGQTCRSPAVKVQSRGLPRPTTTSARWMWPPFWKVHFLNGNTWEHLEKSENMKVSVKQSLTCDVFSQITTWGTQVGKAGCFSCDQTFLCMRTIWMWNDVHLRKKTNVDPSPSGGASQKSSKTNMEALSNFRKQIGEGYMAYRAGTRWQKATWHPFLAMEVDQLRLFGNFQLL